MLDIFFEVLNYETIEQKKAYEIAGLLGELLAAPVPFPCHEHGVTPYHPKEAAHLCATSSSSPAVPWGLFQTLLSGYVVEEGAELSLRAKWKRQACGHEWGTISEALENLPRE